MTAVAATAPSARTGPAAALVAGAIAAFVAVVLIAAAAVLLWVGHAKTDGDGYLTSAAHSYSTPTRALTTDRLEIDGDLPGWLSSGRVRIDPQGAGAFIGIARTSAVDDYLDGVGHDEITDLEFDPFAVETARRSGEGRPARPEAQPIWAASSTAGRPLDWKVREGDWTVVVMNADGSAGVRVDAAVGAKVPLLGALGWGLAIPGVLLGIVAIVLIALGASRSRQTA
jgi:hypothetical protein